jgi:hypothetical protein
MTLADILADPWLWAALEWRKILAPRPRGAPKEKKPKGKKPTKRRRRSNKRAAKEISPDVLPDPDAVTSTSPPAITRSPSERSDDPMPSCATSTTCASYASPSPHRNASPPTPPSWASIESDVDDDLLNFNLKEYRQEVARRRRGGLPLPLEEPDVDIAVRFFLVSGIICHNVPYSHTNPFSRTRFWIPPFVSTTWVVYAYQRMQISSRPSVSQRSSPNTFGCLFRPPKKIPSGRRSNGQTRYLLEVR